MSRTVVLAAAISLALAACSGKESTPVSDAQKAPAQQPAEASTNPLLSASTLPFQAPQFDKIKDSDYLPAFEEGMRQHLADVRKIADSSEPATFDNTIVAMERSGETLTRVSRIFFGLVQADTNDARQKIQEEVAPKLAAHQDEINLDPKLFARVKSLYDQRDTLELDPVQKRLVEHYYDGLVRAGAQLSDADKASLRKLNVEETTLSTQFHTRLVAATAAAAGRRRQGQAGRPGRGCDQQRRRRRQGRKLDGKFLLPLQNTTQQPVLGSLSDRDQRAAVLKASETRAERGDANDTRQTVQRLAQLRAQKAKLLGFDTFADYQLGDQMAKTPAAALKLLTDTVPAATAKARRSRRDPEGDRRAEGRLPGRRLGLGLLRRAGAQGQVRSGRVADQAVLRTGQRAAERRLLRRHPAVRHHLQAAHRHSDLQPGHEGVRSVRQGRHLAGLFYTDYFKRDSKSGGAWMDVFVEQDGLTGAKPVVYNVCNFTKPAAGQPALISFDDVTTMFHEFGHALHGMFSNVKYPSIAGTATSRDFVEFPSQFNEHWALDPKVFANYAKHYKTGEAMPQGWSTRSSRHAASTRATRPPSTCRPHCWTWPGTPEADAPLQDVGAFEASALKKFKVDLPQVPPRYRTTYFDHIWGGGYSAGYYAYFWAEVLDHDAYQWFTEHGGLTAANGQNSATRSSRAATAWSCRPCTAISAARTRRWNRC
jgi:peptidyl-dipeptidase Dcp